MTKNIERLEEVIFKFLDNNGLSFYVDCPDRFDKNKLVVNDLAQAILDAGFVHIDNVGIDISEIKKKAVYVIANHYNEPVIKIFVDEFIDAVVKAKIIKVKDGK